jgi:chemotaxis protein CheX
VHTLRLPAVLDTVAAPPLLAEVRALRGAPLSVDASAVERLGGLCLQVLLAAEAQWQSDGAAFAVVEPSDAFLDALRLAAGAGLASGDVA